MTIIRYLVIGIFMLLFFSISSYAQDLEVPRLGSFQVERNAIPEMKDIWKRDNYTFIHQKLKLPKVTSNNYRTPVDMTSVVARIENSKQAARNQIQLNNIRLSNYNKEEDNASLRIRSNFNADVRPIMPFGTCVHGNTQRYCSICTPRTSFRNFGFGSFGHPGTRGFYYP